MVQNYKKLLVWQKAFDLAVVVYKKTACFPKCERYALSSQMRRAASSISANVVEGASRSTSQDFARFLGMAYSSAKELENFVLLSKELGYLQIHEVALLCQEVDAVASMLFRLRKKVAVSNQ